MELASMIAGEDFSDHPTSVSPMIAALLRAYNDRLEDDHRQCLYRYAADVLGTASGPLCERNRIQTVLEWADQRWLLRARRSPLERLRAQRARGRRGYDPAAAAGYAIRAVGRIDDEAHGAVLALVDRLIAMAPQLRGGRDAGVAAGPVVDGQVVDEGRGVVEPVALIEDRQK